MDKASGWTSHDVVAVVRATLRVRRVGHGGTLDPLATGLLPVLVGSATKFADRLHTASKAYAAVVRFGTETTTDDREGSPRREARVPDVGRGEIDQALAAFRGEIVQVPPDFAAVKIGGRRAYAIARSGATVAVPPRRVTVERIAVASWRPPALRVLIVCGSGTYVRALARDIGRALGSAAHLAALRRAAVGRLTVEDAVDVGKIRAQGRSALVAELRPADDGLLEMDDRYRTADPEDVLHGWESA
ncbi:MAG: tRNA pseudouridine(55) synthase TruB [Chloroflexota bacterium]|nr:tRNA pseudouridine(55) synthase TruB [Chloroflexota bacterium]